MADSKKIQEELASVKALDKILSQTLDNRLKGAKEANALQDEFLKKLREEQDISEDLIKDIREYEEKMQEILEGNTKGGKALKSQLDIIKQITTLEEARKVADEKIGGALTGQVDALEDKIKSFPILGDTIAKSINFDKIKEGAGEMVTKFTNGFTEASMAGKGFGGSMKAALGAVSKGLTMASVKQAIFNAVAMVNPYVAIAAAIIGVILLIKKLISLGLELDQTITDFGRELGVANDTAREMYDNFNDMSVRSGDLSISTKALVESQKQLASSIGMTAQYSATMLKDQIKLTKYMGMSGEEAAGFQKMAAASGKTARELQREVASTVGGFNELTGASVDFAGVMREIAGLSLEMRARFRGNVKEMALAVAQAKALGTTLQESSDAAQNLLNMESSLKAEMKARMITGVNINNDEIRRAQLMGDQAEVLRLQAKQLGEIGDISNKLPHEQRAIAEAMGMSVDQMLKMSEQQKVMKRLNVDTLDGLKKEDIMRAGLSDKEADAMIKERERMSNQEKMAAAMDKMKEAGTKIVIAFMPLIDVIGMIASGISTLLGFLEPVLGILGGIVGGFMVGGPLGALVGGVVGAISDSKKWFGGDGEGTSDVSVDDAVISPDGGVITTSPEDFLIATKNPAGLADKVAGAGGAAGIDYDRLAAALASQPLQIIVDGKVVSAITRKQNTNKSYNRMMG